MHITKLNNELKILYYPVSTSHTVSIGLYINSGSYNENSENNGISHLLEHMHFRKLNSLTQEQLYSYTEKMGTTLRATTYKDFIRFYIKIRPSHIFDSIIIFKKIIETYDWSEYEFESEKNVVLNELYEKEDYIKIDRFKDSIVWKNHPLSLPIIGTYDSLKGISLEMLVKYKKEQFTRENMFLVITGKFDEHDEKIICDILSKIKINTFSTNKTFICKKQFCRKPDIKLYNFHWDITEICLSFDIPYKYNASKELFFLNSIIGGGDGALLQKNIREKDCITSNIYSDIEYHKNLSVFNIYCSVNSSNVMYSINKIIDILNNVKQKITDEDYDTNIKFFTDNLWFLLDDIQELNYQIGFDLIFRNKDCFTIEEKIKENEMISKTNLIELAKNIFTPNNASILIMGKTNMLRHYKLKEIILNL